MLEIVFFSYEFSVSSTSKLIPSFGLDFVLLESIEDKFGFHSSEFLSKFLAYLD